MAIAWEITDTASIESEREGFIQAIDSEALVNLAAQHDVVIRKIAARGEMPRYRYDQHGRVRLVLNITTFSGYTDAALNQIRQNGQAHASVLIRMLETIALLGEQVRKHDQREALLRHAGMILRAGVENLIEQADREDVQRRYLAAERVLAVNNVNEP